MTSTVAEHYANHLAPIYSWMVGDFDAACAQADAFYYEIGLPPGSSQLALDLGCGHGIHSIPLARRGYELVSIDSSGYLLKELESRAGGLAIRTACGDLADFPNHLGDGRAALIVCMGDTLTHLPSQEHVWKLIRDAASAMTPNGLLCVSLRDYATSELVGEERFILVRSDATRIHTGFLEYHGAVVHVYDILHHNSGSGWKSSVSSYQKIRLRPDDLIASAAANGFALFHRSVERGMIRLAFRYAQSQIAA